MWRKMRSSAQPRLGACSLGSGIQTCDKGRFPNLESESLYLSECGALMVNRFLLLLVVGILTISLGNMWMAGIVQQRNLPIHCFSSKFSKFPPLPEIKPILHVWCHSSRRIFEFTIGVFQDSKIFCWVYTLQSFKFHSTEAVERLRASG